MRLLLDTHIALWALTNDPRLNTRARELISDPDNEISVSAVSVWEIAIKHALQRTGLNAMPISGDQGLALFRAAGFLLLPITAEDAAGAEALPPVHTDPFDRLLVAQAMAGPFRLLTHDARVAAYSDAIIHV